MFDGLRIFLKRNFVATITGGLYLDRERSAYINTAHFYTFFLLYSLPTIFIIYLGKENLIFEITYPIITLLIFFLIKLGNFFFHYYFNHHEKLLFDEKNKEISIEKTEEIKKKKVIEEPKKRTETFSYIDEFGITQSYTIPSTESNETPSSSSDNQSSSSEITIDVTEKKEEDIIKEKYYFKIFSKSIPIPFDRLNLEELLDRDYTLFHFFGSIFLAAFISWFSFRLCSIIDDYFLICLIYVSVASSQFSLLKSPQPDAHSPQHFSRITSFSRGFYFCLFTSLSYGFYWLNLISIPSFTFYGITINLNFTFLFLKDFFIGITILFPFIFLFGYLPSTPTFFMVLLEEIHIQFFGGTGFINLIGGIMQIIFDLLVLGILFGASYYSASQNTFGNDFYSGIYSGILVSSSYFLSRSPSNYLYYIESIKDIFKSIFYLCSKNKRIENETEKYENNTAGVRPLLRIFKDILMSFIIFLPVITLQIFDPLKYLQPYFQHIISGLIIIIGYFHYYLIPELVKPQPWSLLKYPLISKSNPINLPKLFKYIFGLKENKIRWYEMITLILKSIEFILYNLLILSQISISFFKMNQKYHPIITILFISTTSMKILRIAYSDSSRLWIALLFSEIIFSIDYVSEMFMLDLSISIYLISKFETLLKKLHFIFIYSIPTVSYSSLLHILLHPLGLPHTALGIFQIFLSVLFSAPIYPFIGSPLWLLSYPRSIKYWEKSYNTKRRDINSTKLSSSLNENDDSTNFNSIFYEHMVVALRRGIQDSFIKGEFGTVQTGDMFIVFKEKLTCLVHFIEIGNGFATFQLRGLEFKGTICQDREVEALENSVDESYYTGILDKINDKIDNSNLGDVLKNCFGFFTKVNFLTLKKILSLRMQTWNVLNLKLDLRTYNVNENNAVTLMTSFEQRSDIIFLFVKSILYYMIESEELDFWISTESPAPISTINDDSIDLDPSFSSKFEKDYDEYSIEGGISYNKFKRIYETLIKFLLEKKKENNFHSEKIEKIISLGYLLSLVGRRLFVLNDGTHSATHPSKFVGKIYQLFKNDFRIISQKDEWIFGDVKFLKMIISPALKMSLRLYQDSFIGETYEDNEEFFDGIEEKKPMILSYEGEEIWRESILSDKNDLFSLRKIHEEDQKDPKFTTLMLEMRNQNFKIIKLNSESVRSLWAAQTNELIFFGSEAFERGSIQNMVEVLRNIINQCCDAPVGYPVYISPLTTAYW
eukprot:gene1942-1450_t